MPSADPAYVDEHDNLAITAIVQVPLDAFAEQIELVFPYALLPEGVGGLMEVELVAFDQQGEALASSGYSVELPDDVDRSPDVLTVLAHTLVTLARADGPLTREGVRRIRDVLVRDFDLDALGVRFLKRILKIAAGVHHTPVTLAEVARQGQTLERLHQKHVLPGFNDDEAKKAEEGEIERLTQQITRGFHDCHRCIKKVEQMVRDSKAQGQMTRAEEVMAKNIQVNLATRVQEASANFRKKQSAYLKS